MTNGAAQGTGAKRGSESWLEGQSLEGNRVAWTLFCLKRTWIGRTEGNDKRRTWNEGHSSSALKSSFCPANVPPWQEPGPNILGPQLQRGWTCFWEPRATSTPSYELANRMQPGQGTHQPLPALQGKAGRARHRVTSVCNNLELCRKVV